MGFVTGLLGFLAPIAKWAFAWWTDRQAQKHDVMVETNQQTKDSLQGESDALRQVDTIGAALDTGGVRIADDPANRNR